MAGARWCASAGGGRGRVGFGWRIAGRRICCRGAGSIAGGRRCGGRIVGFEICRVPARTFELKTGRRQLLRETGFAALGAIRQRRV